MFAAYVAVDGSFAYIICFMLHGKIKKQDVEEFA
jgi:hypothetical protein